MITIINLANFKNQDCSVLRQNDECEHFSTVGTPANQLALAATAHLPRVPRDPAGGASGKPELGMSQFRRAPQLAP